MSYICVACHVLWPCLNVEHNAMWHNRQQYPDGHHHSIACYVLDHEECTVPMFCKCRCHQEQLDREPPITASPSNR